MTTTKADTDTVWTICPDGEPFTDPTDCPTCDGLGFVPVKTKTEYMLVIMRGDRVVNKWPKRNEKHVLKCKQDWEHDRDTRSVFYKGCVAVVHTRHVTDWIPTEIGGNEDGPE